MPHARRAVGVFGVLAALMALLTLPGLPAASAAGVCPDATGVVVVVDFGQLGGGVQQHCVAGSGGAASGIFGQAGYSLDYVQREPGFVCRVAGKPSADPCVNTPPANAYWGLFWSDGKSGTWSYATTGAQSLRIPSGGYVGFAWQGQSGQVKPGMTPIARLAQPSPSPSSASPSSGAGSSGSGSSGSPTKHKTRHAQPSVSPTPAAASESAESSASAAPTGPASPKAKKSAKSAQPSPSSVAPTAPAASAQGVAAEPPRQAGVGAPWWAVLGVAVLLGAGGLWWRRQRSV